MKAAAKLYVRQGPTVEVHSGGSGTAEFVENKRLIRAEEQLAGVAILRPTPIVKVTGI